MTGSVYTGIIARPRRVKAPPANLVLVLQRALALSYGNLAAGSQSSMSVPALRELRTVIAPGWAAGIEQDVHYQHACTAAGILGMYETRLLAMFRGTVEQQRSKINEQVPNLTKEIAALRKGFNAMSFDSLIGSRSWKP